MNSNYRILLITIMAALGLQDIKAQEPMPFSYSNVASWIVQGGLYAGSLIGLACGAKAVYCKYLLSTTPKVGFDINWRARSADNPIRISQWYAFDKSLCNFPLSIVDEMRPHEIIENLQSKIAIKRITDELINACKEGKVALYYANGEIENRERKITYQTILHVLHYEKRRLLKYVKQLESFTDVPDIYEYALQEAHHPNIDCEDKARFVSKKVNTYLQSLYKKQGWLSWFKNSLFNSYQKEIGVAYWNLKISYCWVKVLETCMKYEFDRLNKEQEEQRLAPRNVGRAIRN